MTDSTTMDGATDPIPSESTAAALVQKDRLRALLDRAISREEVAENTRAVAAVPVTDAQRTTSLLLGAIGGERLAFDAVLARRVVMVARVHRIPHRGSSVFGGLCAIGGELVLVARLDRLLGFEQRGSEVEQHRMVVIGPPGRSWALTLDRVDGVQRFDHASFLAPPATVARALDGMTRALARAEDGSLISILDGERLLRSCERSMA